MAGISKETIDRVRTSVDIVPIVGEYVSLEQRGNQWWGCCPFHSEKTPSFSVTPDKHMYYCFGCHAGGDVIKFVRELEKFSFTEAVEFIAKKAGIEVTYSDNGYSAPDNRIDSKKTEYIELYNRVADMFHYGLLNTEAGKFALNYITGRGLSLETIKKFKIGYSPADRKWLKAFLKSKNFSDEFLNESGLFSKKYPDFAFFSDRLMFPIFDRRGQVVAFGGRFLRGDSEKSPKYLNSGGDLIQYQKRETLFAFNFAKNSISESKRAIICEGYMDCIAYHQCGITNAVATCGTALTDEQIKMLKAFAKNEIILSFDSDGAGQEATKRGILMCRRQGVTVKVIRLHGGKDPAEIMINLGKDSLTNDVNNAILDSDYLLSNLVQKYPVDTPEGKTRAILEFFPYIDSLQNDIQKESCFELLSQRFNVSPEAILRDFKNRSQGMPVVQPVESRQTSASVPIKLDSELRTVLAVISDTNQFELMNSSLTDDDFENPCAKYLFNILKDCSNSGNFSFNEVADRCKDEKIQALIAQAVASGEFSHESKQSVVDGIALIKRKRLECKKKQLLAQIEPFKGSPEKEEDQLTMTAILEEIMNIDNLLKNL